MWYCIQVQLKKNYAFGSTDGISISSSSLLSSKQAHIGNGSRTARLNGQMKIKLNIFNGERKRCGKAVRKNTHLCMNGKAIILHVCC